MSNKESADGGAGKSPPPNNNINTSGLGKTKKTGTKAPPNPENVLLKKAIKKYCEESKKNYHDFGQVITEIKKLVTQSRSKRTGKIIVEKINEENFDNIVKVLGAVFGGGRYEEFIAKNQGTRDKLSRAASGRTRRNSISSTRSATGRTKDNAIIRNALKKHGLNPGPATMAKIRTNIENGKYSPTMTHAIIKDLTAFNKAAKAESARKRNVTKGKKVENHAGSNMGKIEKLLENAGLQKRYAEGLLIKIGKRGNVNDFIRDHKNGDKIRKFYANTKKSPGKYRELREKCIAECDKKYPALKPTEMKAEMKTETKAGT